LFLIFLVGLGIHQFERLLPVFRDASHLRNIVGVEPGFCAYARDNSSYNEICNSLDFTPAGPTSWMFLLCGLLIYGLERILRIVRSFYSVVIIKVIKHPSNTIEIQMRRKGFHAEAGQVHYYYVFITAIIMYNNVLVRLLELSACRFL
jgi:NADPH oxidase